MAFSTRRPSSPASSSVPPLSYEVFLSFRGEDTRYGFVDHLQKAFQQRGFIVFKDDKKLEQGSIIAEALFKAIKESQYAVVVISKNFAESKWCLNELIEILRCKRESGLKVLPIFYHVDPSDVRRQKGIFAKAFAKHQEDPEIDGEKMRTWRAALKEVGEISGWHVDNSSETTIVEQIATSIFRGLQLRGLRLNSSEIFKNLVVIKSRVKELESLLRLEMDDVRFIGIHGMGSCGKTTLAKALYDIVRCDFDASSFICCSNDSGSINMVTLQEQIIYEIMGEDNTKIFNHHNGTDMLRKGLHNKRVFIVFDDVNHDQLKGLAGSLEWFDKGSRIVVTSRDCEPWKSFVSVIYEVDPLEHNDALQLFCRKAFNRSFPKNDFALLSECVIRLVEHLPLALEVIGSFLCDKEIDVWMSALNDLECLEDVFSKLRTSYNGLNELQKEMFLDIACFFCGVSKLEILPIFDTLGYNPTFNFEVFLKKSLIKISREGKIWMHGLLREMGRQIVNSLSLMELGNRSRLWRDQDIARMLKNNSGTNAIKGIVFNPFRCSPEELCFEVFSKMRKLTILILNHTTYDSNVHFCQGRAWFGDPSKLILSNELRVLQWLKFPLESLPSSFHPDNLVKLSMRDSKIKVLWRGKRAFDKLKCIELCYSEKLMEIPDLSGIPNLEELDFGWCIRLRKLHPSIGTLKNLLLLNLQDCHHVKRLPKKIYWESLESLELSYCTRLENFPKNVSIMTSLRNLNLKKTGMKMQSFGMKSLSSLTRLNTSSVTIGSKGVLGTLLPNFIQFVDSHCNSNSCLDWLSGFSHLTDLNLSNCNLSDGDIPGDISFLSSLRCLNLSGNIFVTLPDCFCLLTQLSFLAMNDCRRLRALPKLPLRLFDLEVENCPLLEMSYHQTKVKALQLCNSVWFSVVLGEFNQVASTTKRSNAQI